MKTRTTMIGVAALLVLVPVAATAQRLGAAFQRTHEPRFALDLSFFEMDPKHPLAGFTLVGAQSGMGGDGESASMLTSRDGDLRVRVIGHATGDRFPVEVEVGRVGEAAGTPPQRHQLDLTDLAPRQIDLGPARNGRTLKLNLVPRIGTERPEPRDLRPHELLYTWNLSGAVLWNNEFRGLLGDVGGQIAYVAFPDLGSFSFALLPFDGASVAGEYDPQAQVVVIRSGDDLLIVEGARVGSPPVPLAGGPYRVWVRRDPLDAKTKEMVRTMRQRLEESSDRLTPEQRQVMLAKIENGEAIGHGIRGGGFVWRHGRLEVMDRTAGAR